MRGFSTPLSRQLGLQYPICIAPMFIISNVEMILAAAEAGVMAAMPSLNCRTPEDFANALATIRRKTDKPFGINIPLKLAAPERIQHDIDKCIEYKVPVIITSLGSPAEVVKRAHEKGLKVFHDVINLRHGQAAKRAGVDAVIAVAAGAGGHAGAISQNVLVPWLKRELQLPIVAAGCISGGAQIAAAMALGAEMVYMGTRFIASTECAAEEAYKNLVIASSPEDIVYTEKVSGIPGNYIKQTVPGFAPEGAIKEGAKKWKDIWSAGQGVGLIDQIMPIGHIVEQIVREYYDVYASMPRPS